MKLLTAGLMSMVLCAAVLAEEPVKPAMPPAATPPAGTQPAAVEVPGLESARQKASYAVGLNFGMDYKKRSIEIDTEAMARGFRDAMAGSKAALSDQQMKDAVAAYGQQLMAEHEAKVKAEADKNKVEGAAYLEKNKKVDGVKVMPSGLQIQVIKEGAGEKAKLTDRASVLYKGTLVDGTEFDSTAKHGDKPAEFDVNDRGLIPGWTEALQLMQAGGKYRIVLPSNLAYGEQPDYPGGPNSVLIFEIEVVKLAPAPPAAPAGAPSGEPMMPQ